VVTFSSEELFLEILKADYDYEKLRQFREESYQYLDGKSTERVVKLITG
jgi:CDP-glycerol glycerophosphotransferase (TagB/SpsB family)